MGLLDFIMSGGMTKEARERRERTDAYAREMKAHWAEYRPKLEQARERWANTQKEMYKTTGAILVPGANGGITSARSKADAEADSVYAIAEELTEETTQLQEKIDDYKKDKADAIRRYSNPE